MKRSIGGTKFENTPQSRYKRKLLRTINAAVRKHFPANVKPKALSCAIGQRPSIEEGD